jgi:hypothetical protein
MGETPMTDIATKFKEDTTDHKMTILHDEGLYRHLRFQKQGSSFYWFELITAPGSLSFQGDGDAFVFRRDEDMFTFFRMSAWRGRPNFHYWAQKLVSYPKFEQYDQELMQRFVDESVAEAVRDDPTLIRLAEDVRYFVTEELISDESLDRSVVENFKHWTNKDDKFKNPKPAPDFKFQDTWEVSLRDYDPWFLWACEAILWGIGQYDAVQVQEVRGKTRTSPAHEIWPGSRPAVSRD